MFQIPLATTFEYVMINFTMTASVVENLGKYGRALTEYGGVTESGATFPFTAADLKPTLEALASPNDESLAVGFLAVVPIFVAGNWSSFTANQITSLKSDLLRVCNRPFSTSIAHQLTSFVALVMRLTETNWPEVYSFVLNEARTGEVVGFMISKVVRFADSSTLVQHRFKLLDRIIYLFPKVSQVLKLRLLRAICDLKMPSIAEDFLVKFWKMVNAVLPDIGDDIHILYRIVKDLFSCDPRAKRDLPEFDNEEQFQRFIPLITLLSPDGLETALTRIITTATRCRQAGNWPLEIGLKIKRACDLGLPPDHVERAVAILKRNNANPDLRSATVFAVLPFLPHAITETTKLEDIGITWFSDFSSGIAFDQTVWLYSVVILLEKLRMCKMLPQNIAETVLSLIRSSYPSVQRSAYSALKAMFENFMFSNCDQITPLFNVYSTIEPGQKFEFVNCLTSLIENGGFDAAMLQPIVEFVHSSLRMCNDVMIMSAFMSLINSMGTLSARLVASFVKVMLPLISTVVASNKPAALPPAAQLLSTFVAIQPALSRRTLSSVFPKLVAFVKSNAEPKERGLVAESVAEIVDGHYKKRELANTVAIITSFVSSGQDELVIAGANMTSIMLKTLDRLNVTEVFACLTRAAIRTKREKVLNVVVETIRKLMKFQASQNQGIIVRLAYWLISASHPIFEKQPIWNWICPDTSVFPFITGAIEKYPQSMVPLTPYLIQICQNSSDEMFTMIFDSVAAAYGMGLVKNLPSERLYEVCYRDVFTHHSTVALTYVIENVTDKIADFTAKLCEEWTAIQKQQNLWHCAVSDSLFRLAARRQKVDLAILQLILEEFPQKAEYGYGESLCQAIIEAFQNNHDLEPIELTLLKKFSDFFMLNQSDFLAYHINYDLQMDMKTLMRTIYSKNKQYEREISRYYGGNKLKVSNFLLLVQ